MAKVSIILPAYNNEDCIEKCLDSLSGQTLDDIEIIIVDDGSSDRTKDIIKSYQEKDPRIKCLKNETNKGILLARKRGVLASEGEYIMFSDADDSYELEACAELYEEIKRRDLDILMYDARTIGGAPWLERMLKSKPEEIREEHAFARINRMNLLWNKIFRGDICRKAYAAAEDMFLVFGEDTYACWMIHFFATSFGTVQKVYYNYQAKGGASNQEKMSPDAFEEFIKQMSGYVSAVKNFLGEQDNAEKLLSDFHECSDDYLMYFVDKWHNVLESDKAQGFKTLCAYFDSGEIAEKIDERWAQTDKALESQKASRESWKARAEELQNEVARLKEEKKNLKNRLKQSKEKLEKTRGDLRQSRENCKTLKKKIRELNDSTSMKAGKLVTCLPRKIKNVISR